MNLLIQYEDKKYINFETEYNYSLILFVFLSLKIKKHEWIENIKKSSGNLCLYDDISDAYFYINDLNDNHYSSFSGQEKNIISTIQASIENNLNLTDKAKKFLENSLEYRFKNKLIHANFNLAPIKEWKKFNEISNEEDEERDHFDGDSYNQTKFDLVIKEEELFILYNKKLFPLIIKYFNSLNVDLFIKLFETKDYYYLHQYKKEFGNTYSNDIEEKILPFIEKENIENNIPNIRKKSINNNKI